MKKYFINKILNKNAQDMVEFAMVLPILMFMFMFVLTGGQMIFNKQVAFNMVYQGCRSAVTSSYYEADEMAAKRAGEFITQAIAMKSWNIELEKPSPSNWKSSSGRFISSTNYCSGTVEINMITLFPIRGIMTNTFPIHAKTKMVIEYNPDVNYEKTGTVYSLD